MSSLQNQRGTPSPTKGRLVVLTGILLIFPMFAYGEPEVVFRISGPTLSELIESAVPRQVPVSEPAGGEFRINSVSPDPVVANQLVVKGVLLKRGAQDLPVAATVKLSVDLSGDSVLITPVLSEARIDTAAIPITQPLTLLRAWLLSSLSLVEPRLQPIDLSMKTHLDLASTSNEIRTRKPFGHATAEVVASTHSAGATVELFLARAALDKGQLWIALSQSPHPDSVQSQSWPDVGAEDGLKNVLFLHGSFLAEILNRVAGTISIPFHLENPRGRIESQSSSTLFGTREWYLEFEGKRPLIGQIDVLSRFAWNDRLTFLSEVSVRASGRIHGHGDPGPGGGCGVRPRFSIKGRHTLAGTVDVAGGSSRLSIAVGLHDSPQVSLAYDVERVNFCGFTTEGPFRGSFPVDLPDEVIATSMDLEPFRVDLPDGSIAISRIGDVLMTDGGLLGHFSLSGVNGD